MTLCSILRQAFLATAILSLLLVCPMLSAKEHRSIYLIRHAEKQHDGTHDPSLTEKGVLRAKNICKQLKNRNITTIYSTNYKRTVETALPLSKSLAIDLTLYDPNQLETFATQVLLGEGNVLIVGHSNTTPELVALLGGNSQGPMADSVYHQIFHLVVKGNKTDTIILSSSVD